MNNYFLSKDNWLVYSLLLGIFGAVMYFGIQNNTATNINMSQQQTAAVISSTEAVTYTVSTSQELLNALIAVRGGERILLNPGTYNDITIYKKTSTSPNSDRMAVGDELYKLNVTPVLTAPVTITSADPNNRAVVRSINVTNSEWWRFEGLSIRPSPRRGAIKYVADNIAIIDNDISYGDATNWTDADWTANAGMAIEGTKYDASRPRSEVAYNYIKNVSYGIMLGDNVYAHHNIIRKFWADGMRARSNNLVEHNLITDPVSVDGTHMDAFQSFTKDASGKVGAGVNSNTVIRNNTMVLAMDGDSEPDSFQAIGMFDGMFENWMIENNLIINNHQHGISVYGGVNSTIQNNATFTYSPELFGMTRGYISFKNHKDGRPSTGSFITNNISPNLPVSNSGVTVSGHTQVTLADYDKYFVDYRNFDFTLKPGAIPFPVGAVIDYSMVAPEPYADASVPDDGPAEEEPPAAPTLSFDADKTSVMEGEQVLLTWSSTDATSCTASDNWNGEQVVSGSFTTEALSVGTADFTLTCEGEGGTVTESISIEVTAIPVVDQTLSLGDVVVVTEIVKVRNFSGLSSKTLGKRQAGDAGIITKGPQSYDTFTWWYVDFDTGLDGWVAGEFLRE